MKLFAIAFVFCCVLAQFAFVNAFTGPSFKLKATYYDFHENGTCPEFEWQVENFVFGYKDIGLILPTLDVARKPVRNLAFSLGPLYKVENIEKWFREWHEGDMIYKLGDTVLVPIDSVCYYEPVIDDTMCGNYTYDSIKTPSGYYPGDTLYKNMKVEDSLSFVLRAAPYNGANHNFYMLESNANNITNFFPLDGKGFEAIEYPRYFTSTVTNHNYSFTMELHYTFTYHGTEVLMIGGDDDIYAFVNNRLVVDLGGLHNTFNDTVSLDTLGLTIGQTYNFDLFFAERHTTGSHFSIKTDMDFQQNITLGTRHNASFSPGGKTLIDFGAGFMIKAPQATRYVSWSLVDLSGKIVYCEQYKPVNELTINTGNNRGLSAGMYIVEVKCLDNQRRYLTTVANRFVSIR